MKGAEADNGKNQIRIIHAGQQWGRAFAFPRRGLVAFGGVMSSRRGSASSQQKEVRKNGKEKGSSSFQRENGKKARNRVFSAEASCRGVREKRHLNTGGA